MKYAGCKISLQEVPGEITLIFEITSCPHRCKGCHSSELWLNAGAELDQSSFEEELMKYAGLITCVCFFGGEWEEGQLVKYLKQVKGQGYKTCLYTGATSVSKEIGSCLNYLKIGHWDEKLGGLDSLTTNQKFLNLDNGTCLNHIFQHTHGVKNA